MTAFLVAAGLLAWLTALVHAWLGGREILQPALAAPLGSVVRGVLETAWHIITWHFVVLGGALLGGVWLEHEVAAAIALVAGASALGHAVLFLALGFRRFGDPWHMPQWVLFVPFAGLALAAPYVGELDPSALRPLAAGLAVLLFVAIAGLHFAWAAGATFPARDHDALVAAVVSRPIGSPMPDPLATLVVAVGLLGFAAWTAALGGLASLPVPDAVLRVGGYATIAIFGLRCIGGFFEAVLRPSIRGTPYVRLSRVVYSPLAGLLAVLVACAMLR